MAGSYKHVTTKNGKLISNEKFPEMIENLGDAYEAVEEMYHMIQFLSRGDKNKIEKARKQTYKKRKIRITDLDIATVEQLHDRLWDKYDIPETLQKKAQNLIARMYKALKDD